MKNLVIAVDGPAGAGKSTIAKLIAEKLNINYIDTGAMYRAITYKCLQNNIDINNEEEVIKIAKDCEIDFKDNNIYLNGEILKDEIRTMEVSNNVSNVANKRSKISYGRCSKKYRKSKFCYIRWKRYRFLCIPKCRL